MKNKVLMGTAAIFLLAVLGVGMVSAFGFGDGFMKPFSDGDREAMQEERDAMQNAIESEDYATWKSLMEAQIAKMQEQITEENFNEIVEMHQKMAEMREARESFCDENDCPMPEGRGPGFRGHFGMEEIPEISE